MKDVWKRNLPQITLQAFRTLSLKLHIKFNNWVALLKYRCFSVIIMIPLLLEPIIAVTVAKGYIILEQNKTVLSSTAIGAVLHNYFPQ